MDTVLAGLAEFASEITFDQLPENAVIAAKDRLLDSLGCALGALDCDTATIGKSLAGAAASPDMAGWILGASKPVAADAAAFVNSCMIRNLDFNDTYPGGHPSDCIGGLFAVAPQIGVSGEMLITATVIAYEMFIRLQMAGQFRERGWDQGLGISVGTTAAVARMMGLNREAIQHAIAITAVGNTQMRATRAGQLSMWKGAGTAYAVRNAVFGAQLAAKGMTGPEGPFLGRHGVAELITEGKLELPPFGTSPEHFFIPRAKIKYWPVVYNMQALVWAGIELRRQVPVEQLASVTVETYWSAWHESGSEPAKWDPRTRETADHSLPYILSWVLRHGIIDHNAFVPEAYLDPAARPLMNIITARIEEEFEEGFPDTVRMRVRATDKAGKDYRVDIVNPLGHEKNPVSAEQLDTKIQHLCEPVFGAARSAAIIAQWRRIEHTKNVAELFHAVEAPAIGAK